MQDILSVSNMRASDAAAIQGGTPGRELMFRAGKGIFEAVSWKPPVAIVCGSGNNAGDGYVLAKLLREAGLPCWLVLLSGDFSADGRFYYDAAVDSGVEVRDSIRGAATVVDCIFGTGFHGAPRLPYREAIQAVNDSGAYVVSVDINSGLNGDSGMAELCVRSDLTVSVGGFKPGHFLGMAKDVIRDRVNLDIGIPPLDRPCHLMEAADAALPFRPRPNLSNKGTYGYLALIGGSARYSGAVRLASQAAAAMRAGAGVVKTAFPAALYPVVAPALLEATAFPLPDRDGEIAFDAAALEELTAGIRSAAFGMGIGTSPDAGKALAWLLANFRGNLIIDADGLNLLSRMDPSALRETGARVFLTPHLKEFSRLTGKTMDEINAAPIDSAVAYARENHVLLLLKGPATIVTDGEEVLLTATGCPGMATAGSGDVLSGILAAMASWAPDPLTALASAAWINGRAGEKAQAASNAYSMTAGDTVAHIPEVITELLRLREAEK